MFLLFVESLPVFTNFQEKREEDEKKSEDAHGVDVMAECVERNDEREHLSDGHHGSKCDGAK